MLLTWILNLKEQSSMVDDQYLINNSMVREVKVCKDRNRNIIDHFTVVTFSNLTYECKRGLGWYRPQCFCFVNQVIPMVTREVFVKVRSPPVSFTFTCHMTKNTSAIHYLSAYHGNFLTQIHKLIRTSYVAENASALSRILFKDSELKKMGRMDNFIKVNSYITNAQL